MAEPLKAVYEGPFLRQFAALVRSAWAPFEEGRFISLVTADDWERLELKARIRRIAQSLGKVLPQSYEEALDVLYRIDGRCIGFPYLFFPDFVEVYGTDDWELSMQALERFTPHSSAEFAIRPFIAADPERTMARMRVWAEHGSEHVRRLASEGCRPRLPWAAALPMFKRDPAPVLPILERLKADPSLYVRKSVANNLNDISKDHPDLVRSIAARWRGTHEWTDWIVRRGCRSMVRDADPEAMALLGYTGDEPSLHVESAGIEASRPEAAIGEMTELRYRLTVRDGDAESLKLRLELGVDYVKAKGNVSRKKFLLKEAKVTPGMRIEGTKRLDWSDRSTRKHYPGVHKLALLVNGQAVAEANVLLAPEGGGGE